MKKIAKTLLMISIFFATTTLFSCNGKETKKTATEEVETVYAVNADVVHAGNLDNYLEFGGDVSSLSEVDVFPDVAGKISRIMVSVGDTVQKNQILAYVDASKPGMNYSESPVKSTITGRVSSIPPMIGSTVSQGTCIAKVSDTDELQIKVNVAERYISRIKDGQAAIVTFDAYPGVEFNARVFEIAPVLDTTSRTMLVKLRVEPVDPRIKVGMYARVRLVTEVIENAVVVSSDAIIYRDEKPYVFVVNEDKANNGTNSVSRIAVVEGLKVDDKIEIKEGLKDGDIIIIKGQSLLSDGSKVKLLSISGKSVD